MISRLSSTRSSSSSSSDSSRTSGGDRSATIIPAPAGATIAKQSKHAIASREFIVASRVRSLIILFLLICTITVAALVYTGTREMARRQMQDDFDDLAGKVLDSFGGSVKDSLMAFDSFAVSMVSYSKANNMEWPFVTIPDYGTRASKVRSVSNSVFIAQLPVVNADQISEWNQYSRENGQIWQDQNLKVQKSDPTFSGLQEDSMLVNSAMWPPRPDVEMHRPIWQHYPSVPIYGFSPINLDFGGDSDLNKVMNMLMDRKASIGRVQNDPTTSGTLLASNEVENVNSTLASYEQSNKLMGDFISSDIHEITEPSSILAYPIFDDVADTVDATQSVGGRMVSITVSWFHWRNWLQNILPQDSNGIIAVFENGCNQSFSYEINGADPKFLGYHDAHDRGHESMEVRSTLQDLQRQSPTMKQYTGFSLSDDLCSYTVEIYPSKKFEEQYMDNRAVVYTSVAVAIFVFTTAVFVLYDHFVERRQRKLLSAALKSSAIVSSLFPENVHHRLYGEDDASSQANSQKENLKTFMNGGGMEAGPWRQDSALAEKAISKNRPIADLFPSATVMFGDIAGFTAWSSQRQPSQVFILLESLYSLFDTLAAKRGVFKVETIGDCYMAVAGLPDPRPDHAIICAKFAKDCCFHMVELLTKLAVSLGPDTEDLAMRFGLNSGPVTAGVLRGQKSRFQLFGDTVNTASRMETTGERNRIHVPSQIALRAPEVHDEGRDNRLVDWNVDNLAGLLRAVIARQIAIEHASSASRLDLSDACNLVPSAIAIEEVKEVVELPEFDPELSTVDPDSVEIDPVVSSQLRNFVSEISETYVRSSNPFHNFEHASHVCMSVSKLMSRIVAADEYYESKHKNQAGSMERFKHQQTFGITSDPLTIFACAFSALIHDADHPGVPNAQLVKEGTELATKYANRSVAEQHSVSVAWSLLATDKYEELRTTICPTPNELKRFRQLIVNVTLATDIMDDELKKLRNERWEKAFHGPTSLNTSKEDMDRKATTVMEHLIQASDVAHTMQHWHVYRKWNERLFEELTKAYEAGRMEADPSTFWYKGELGFFDHYIIPLAKKLSECGVFGVSSDEYLNYALKNREEWEFKGEEIVRKMVAKRKSRTLAQLRLPEINI